MGMTCETDEKWSIKAAPISFLKWFFVDAGFIRSFIFSYYIETLALIWQFIALISLNFFIFITYFNDILYLFKAKIHWNFTL